MRATLLFITFSICFNSFSFGIGVPFFGLRFLQKTEEKVDVPHDLPGMRIHGKLDIEDWKNDNGTIKIFKDSILVGTYINTNKFDYHLMLNHDYRISFEKEGCLTKDVVFNMGVPDLNQYRLYNDFEFNITLFEMLENENYSNLTEPVATVAYNKYMDDFQNDIDYLVHVSAADDYSESVLRVKKMKEKLNFLENSTVEKLEAIKVYPFEIKLHTKIIEIKSQAQNPLNELNALEATVYPNPIVDNLTIDQNGGKVSYSIYDLSGKQVQAGLLQSTKQNLSLAYLSKGNYFLYIETEIGLKTIPFIKN
jgi:hypothetical protein